MYLIVIPYFLQKLQSLIDMNFFLLFIQSVFIKQLNLASTFSSKTWNLLTNLSFF